MKAQPTIPRRAGFTLTELIVVIGLVVLLVVLLLPALNQPEPAKLIVCVNNLKEMNLATKIWSGDYNDKFPAQVSVTNGGAMEPDEQGLAYFNFQVMSNELEAPKILICPRDKYHVVAPNFGAGFSDANISYFINLDASATNPQSFLFGDDNFAINGARVPSGVLTLSTNTPIEWTHGRHVSPRAHFWTPGPPIYGGNVTLADGSVQQWTSRGLQQGIQQSNMVTNRWVIP